MKGLTFGNGQTYARGYDQDGRIASYTLGGISFTVGYDDASRITSIAETGNSPNTNTYGYDALDRLTSGALLATSYGYSYDSVGNRLTKTVNANSDAYTYSTTSNRVATLTPFSGPARSFTLDANGSTVDDDVNTYVYDSRGRLVQSTSSSGTTDYYVNAFGQRVRKTSSAVDTVFHFDLQGRLIAESTAAGVTTKEYIWLGDMPVAVIVSGNRHHVHTDHLNTPRLVANDAQQAVWRWDQQEPFGVNVADENPSGLGVFDQPLRLPGQYFDKETNLHYNYFRDCYDPALGRYCQSDPIGLTGGINTYAYTGSSPLVYSDAEGTSYAALAAGALIGGIGGGLGAAATGGNVWTGVAIGAAAGGAIAAAPTVLPALAGVGGMVAIRVVAGGVGNAASQLLNLESNPCASFNYGSLAASAVGGYASGLRAAGIAQAGLPTTGMAGFAQRAIAGISGAGTATTIGIIGTSLGNPANATGSGPSGSPCCPPNACCSPQ